MSAGRRVVGLSRVPLLAAPLLVPLVVPLERLPPGLAYAVSDGRWLVLPGLLVAALALLLEGTRFDLDLGLWPGRRLPRAVWPALGALGFVLALLAVPPERLAATRFSGDEPKYLRLADSLYHDLDVDVSASSEAPLDRASLHRNLRSLVRATRMAAEDLLRDPFPLRDTAAGSAGQWTVRGRRGGLYHLQSPGLPMLLWPARVLQPFVDPDRPNSLAFATLALLWALTLVQAARLAAEVSGSDLLGIVAGVAIVLQAPLLVGGLHFYPEAACAPALLFLARGLRPGAETPSAAHALCLGVVSGALPWLHPKFSALAVVALGFLWLKLRAQRGRQALALLGAAVPLGTLLLFDHHVTGLLRPDALYVRAGTRVYAGLDSFLSSRTALGLGVGLFGARDGLLVMAPVAIAAFLALPWLWRRQRRALLVLGTLFGGLWLAAAVHAGGAPGPPGRLLAPVLPLLAPALAVGLAELGRRRTYRWTVGLMLAIGLSITLGQLGSWQRVVDPYDGVFPSAAVDFSHDLPDSTPEPGVPDRLAPPLRSALRLLALGAALAFWTVALARRATAGARPAWSAIRDFHLAVWATLLLLATLLHELR